MIIKRNSLKALLFLILTINLYTHSRQSEGFNKLWELYNKREYFKMNSAFRQMQGSLDPGESTAAGGFIFGVFNKPAESNAELNAFIDGFGIGYSDSVMMEIYQLMMLNYVNLYDYRNAVKMTEILLTNYRYMIDSADLEDYNNSSIIWKSAVGLQPQTCSKSGDTKIMLNKDIAGLYNVAVNVNGKESEFIFDTGANFSTITASLAGEMKLNFLKGELKVGTATDIKVTASLAYAENLRIGNMVFQNVLFLVLPDEALTFAGGMYKIDGIIGYPVIREMKEISFNGEYLFVPKVSTEKNIMNLCMYSFTPVVNVTGGKDSMIFIFDTGARKTSLFKVYYDKYKGFIDKNYEKEELEIEGAGGKRKVKGFVLDAVELNAFGKTRKLEDIKLYAENFRDKDKYFYGTIGQDFFSASDKLTINFEYMYIEAGKSQ